MYIIHYYIIYYMGAAQALVLGAAEVVQEASGRRPAPVEVLLQQGEDLIVEIAISLTIAIPINMTLATTIHIPIYTYNYTYESTYSY